MATLSYSDFLFHPEKEWVDVDFLKVFSFRMSVADLNGIAPFSAKDNAIDFGTADILSAEKQFNRLLVRGFAELKSKLTGNDALYIHKNSGIPLIGSLSFGIVDKGTDMIEVKPLTGCNLNCIFCSVDEGPDTKKILDIVIEQDYLLSEVHKLLSFKAKPCSVYINPHGEPLLYSDIAQLVSGLAKIEFVKAVTLITNGCLLTPSLLDRLIGSGLTGVNVSICSLDQGKAAQMAKSPACDPEHIIKLLLAFKDKIAINLTPVYMAGINEKDIEDIVIFCKNNGLGLFIQNFMRNKRGRNPTKEVALVKFYQFLKTLEQKHSMSLLKTDKINRTPELAKPFCKGDKIKADVFSKGRYPGQILAKASGRIVTIEDDYKGNRSERILITEDHHNIYQANPI